MPTDGNWSLKEDGGWHIKPDGSWAIASPNNSCCPPCNACPIEPEDCVQTLTYTHSGLIVQRVNVPESLMECTIQLSIPLTEFYEFPGLTRCIGPFCASCGSPQIGGCSNSGWGWRYNSTASCSDGTNTWTIDTRTNMRTVEGACPPQTTGVARVIFVGTPSNVCPTVPYSVQLASGDFGIEVISPGALTIA